MDITFGDYLRAIITADFDMVAEDTKGYRVAFVEAFQRRGISAIGIKSMAVEDLIHPLNPSKLNWKEEEQLGVFLRGLKESVGYLTERDRLYEKTKELIRGDKDLAGLHRRIEARLIAGNDQGKFSELTGLMFPGNKQATEKLGLEFAYLTSKTASYAVGNVWIANRVTPDGNIVNHVVITLIQKRGVRFIVSKDTQDVSVDEKGFFVPDKITNVEERGENYIVFRGGCTLIFDLDTLRLRYAVKKDVDDRARMIRQFKFEKGLLGEASETYFDSKEMNALAGPFAFMHSHNAMMGDNHVH